MQEKQETQGRFLDWEDSLEEEMAIHSSILAGEPHGQRSLAGYSTWSSKESHTTERTHMHAGRLKCPCILPYFLTFQKELALL